MTSHASPPLGGQQPAAGSGITRREYVAIEEGERPPNADQYGRSASCSAGRTHGGTNITRMRLIDGLDKTLD